MKQLMILIFLLALTLGGKAQELIGTIGAGYFRSIPTVNRTTGNFEFAEGRLMFGRKIRFGPMGNYTLVQAVEAKDNPYHYKGRFYTLGLSTDRWGRILGAGYYFWLTPGIRWSYDRGASSDYQSWQKDKLFCLQSGLRVTGKGNWFSNGFFVAEWQRPLEKGRNRFSVSEGIIREGSPYLKTNFRLTYELGVRKFSFFVKKQEMRFEPIVHLGYGSEKSYSRQYYEYGGGFAFSYLKGWQRELFKVEIFKRQDVHGYNPDLMASQPPRLQVEVVVNLLNLKFNKK